MAHQIQLDWHLKLAYIESQVVCVKKNHDLVIWNQWKCIKTVTAPYGVPTGWTFYIIQPWEALN